MTLRSLIPLMLLGVTALASTAHAVTLGEDDAADIEHAKVLELKGP